MDEVMRYQFIIFTILTSIAANAQSLPNRYQEDVFDTWTETSEVLFSTDVPQPVPGGGFYEWLTGYPLNVDEFETTDEDLYMDIFQPDGDTLSMRPLIIICFGGGFLTGSKDHWSIRLLAEQLARRGFVTATIDYRLGMNIFDSDLSNRAVYRGLQDGRSAVRFFRADAAGSNIYKIDPDQIFIGGHSAGAFIATHNAYLDKDSERPLSTYVWTQDSTDDCPDLGCLDCAGDNQEYSGHANAIFSLAGALGFTDFIEASDDPTMVMFHSEDDGTVPFTNGEPFSDILWLVVGSDLPNVYGSSDMADQADSVGLPYSFLSYTDRGHGVHEDDPVLYTDIISGVEDWFYDDRLKPKNVSLTGDSTVCSDALYSSYHASSISGGYYDWVIDHAESITGDAFSTDVSVVWEEDIPDLKVSLVPYNMLRARGDSLHIIVNKQDVKTNTWSGENGLWTDIAEWSQLRLPRYCDDVIIPTNSLTNVLTLPPNVQSVVRSVSVSEQALLIISNSSSITIKDKDTEE